MKFVHLDCEFVPNNLTPTGLISLAVVIDDDHYYAVNASMKVGQVYRPEWLRTHVWKHLPQVGRTRLDLTHPDVRDYGTIRREVSAFFEKASPTGDADRDLRMVADHGSQDAVRLHTLWGNDWSAMPRWIPRRIDYDLGTLKDDLGVVDGRFPDGTGFPVQSPQTLHHALHDAKYDQVSYEAIRRYQGRQ